MPQLKNISITINNVERLLSTASIYNQAMAAITKQNIESSKQI